MLKFINKKSLQLSAVIYLGLVAGAEDAHATNVSTVSNNILTSITELPALLTGLSYLVGILMATLGVLKIKDHVEQPSNTKIQEGAIRLAAGGALLAAPTVFQAMTETIDAGGAGTVNLETLPTVPQAG
jgi:uncharacterized membrane protein YdcZ (DUF606 family)